jgi:hypothetical protein
LEFLGQIEVWVLVGFLAQMVDGTLGMAYGVSASSLLLSFGLPPATASATVHAAETVVTGFSALSHHYFGNVDRRLFRSLVLSGMAGAAVGAYLLSSVPGEAFKPWVAGYLAVMGVLIVAKAFTRVPPVEVADHVVPLGLAGAAADAMGGGGWGPIVASTLLARGNHARTTVGTVNAAEFFVTLTASVTFFLTLGFSHWPVIAGLALGGMVAAPLGAYACRKIPHRPFMVLVGLLVIALSLRTLTQAI